MLHLVELTLFLWLDVRNLSASRQVVPQAHPQPIPYDCSHCEGQDLVGRFEGSNTCEDDHEGVDGTVKSTVNQRFKDLASLGVVLDVGGGLDRLGEELVVEIWRESGHGI